MDLHLLLFVPFIAAILGYLAWKGRKHLLETRTLLDALDPIAVIDDSYRILQVNAAFAASVGMEPSRIVGLKCHKVFEGSDTPCPGCMLGRCLSERRSFTLPGYLWIHDGYKLFYDIGFHPLAFRGHRRVLEIKRDVSSLHNTRIRLEEQKQQLEFRSQELAVKNRALTAARNELLGNLDEKNQELEMAREMQMSLLPEHPPVANGAKFWVHYDPVQKVGGDIYDFLELGDHRIGIFLGDVAGHGIAAAFVAALARMSLYNNIRRSDNPRFLFRAMNQDLRTQLKTGKYLTALFGVLDLKSNEFTYVRASHPPALVLRTDGSLEKLDSKGMLLGILPDPSYTQQTIRLEPGDRLFLFTDGCFEQAGTDGPRVSYATFTRLMGEYGNIPIESIHGAVALQMRHLLDGQESLDDDKTFMAIEINKPRLADRYRYLLHFSKTDRIVRVHVRNESDIDALQNEVQQALEQLSFSMRQLHGINQSIAEILTQYLEMGPVRVAWSVTEECFKMSATGVAGLAAEDFAQLNRSSKNTNLFLVRTYMDELFMEHGGRTATLFKRKA